MDEFELIRTFFLGRTRHRDDVVLGIGDDAALISTRPGHELVVTTDMLVGGVHFPLDTRAGDIGHKSLAVNLSDLAAMAAEPACATLNLALPRVEPPWLEAFAEGFAALAREHDVELIGGDTVSGPLVIGVQLLGWVPRGASLRRDGARVDDRIYVTGTLGDAAIGLRCARGEVALEPAEVEFVRGRLDRPEPRVREAMLMRGLASAAIDLSDGLLADLGHVLDASGVGASVSLADVPRCDVYRRLQQKNLGWEAAVAHGDDYELCFTVSAENAPALEAAFAHSPVPCTCIGRIESEPGLRLLDEQGREVRLDVRGYTHFGGDQRNA